MDKNGLGGLLEVESSFSESKDDNPLEMDIGGQTPQGQPKDHHEINE